MINIMLYDSVNQLLSFNTERPTRGYIDIRTEPIWLERDGAWVFPYIALSEKYINVSTLEEVEQMTVASDDANRDIFMGISVTEQTGRVHELRLNSRDMALESHRMYYRLPLGRSKETYILGGENSEIAVARMAIAWLRHRKKRVSNKAILETMTTIYGSALMRGYKTVSLRAYYRQ